MTRASVTPARKQLKKGQKIHFRLRLAGQPPPPRKIRFGRRIPHRAKPRRPLLAFPTPVRMGRCPTGGGKKTSAQKNRVGYATKRLRRTRFELPHADVIYKAVHKHLTTGGDAKKPMAARQISSMEAMIVGDPNQPFNEDLPGGGQFYDMFTGRHFESKDAMERHMKTKQYKRDKKRVLNGPAPHEQKDADSAAGMGAPDNGKVRNETRVKKDVVMQ